MQDVDDRYKNIEPDEGVETFVIVYPKLGIKDFIKNQHIQGVTAMTDEQEAERFAHDDEKLKDHDRRITALENGQKSISELTQSVKVLAVNMEHMLTEQKEQGDRLKKLENEPAENAKYYRRTAVACVITTVIGLIIGALTALL